MALRQSLTYHFARRAAVQPSRSYTAGSLLSLSAVYILLNIAAFAGVFYHTYAVSGGCNVRPTPAVDISSFSSCALTSVDLIDTSDADPAIAQTVRNGGSLGGDSDVFVRYEYTADGLSSFLSDSSSSCSILWADPPSNHTVDVPYALMRHDFIGQEMLTSYPKMTCGPSSSRDKGKFNVTLRVSSTAGIDNQFPTHWPYLAMYDYMFNRQFFWAPSTTSIAAASVLMTTTLLKPDGQKPKPAILDAFVTLPDFSSAHYQLFGGDNMDGQRRMIGNMSQWYTEDFARQLSTVVETEATRALKTGPYMCKVCGVRNGFTAFVVAFAFLAAINALLLFVIRQFVSGNAAPVFYERGNTEDAEMKPIEKTSNVPTPSSAAAGNRFYLSGSSAPEGGALRDANADISPLPRHHVESQSMSQSIPKITERPPTDFSISSSVSKHDSHLSSTSQVYQLEGGNASGSIHVATPVMNTAATPQQLQHQQQHQQHQLQQSPSGPPTATSSRHHSQYDSNNVSDSDSVFLPPQTGYSAGSHLSYTGVAKVVRVPYAAAYRSVEPPLPPAITSPYSAPATVQAPSPILQGTATSPLSLPAIDESRPSIAWSSPQIEPSPEASQSPTPTIPALSS
ncbi:hypothetical protein GQ42DRAFT_159916 [Ramicandelaber brevisporus]|nr:hypothetical protein GQ42DRAFT_159916 [Ramicandelaber brevisporus]